MTLVLSDTSTNQGLIEAIKFDTGQDSLTNEEVIRCINLAIDDYSFLALTSSRRWNIDDYNNTDFPIASATVNSSETSVPLETEVLNLEEVTWNGVILRPIDRSEFKDQTPTEVYGSSGTPVAYDYDSHNLFLYPVPNATGTVQIHYSRPENYFATTDTNAAIGLPRIHHKYIIANASEQIAFAKNDPTYQKFLLRKNTEETKIKEFFGLRDQDTPKRLRPLTQDNK